MTTSIGFLASGALWLVACASPGGPSGVGSGSPGRGAVELGMWLEDLALPEGPDLASAGPSNDLGADPSPPDLLTPPDLFVPPDLAGPTLPANGGDTCAVAPALPVGVVVPDQDTSNATNDYDFGSTGVSAACSTAFGLFSYPAPDVAYFFDIPAGNTLKVSTTWGGWDGAVGIVGDCAMPKETCLAGSDGVAQAESTQYANTSGASKRVFIIIDGYLASQKGKFSIRADLL